MGYGTFASLIILLEVATTCSYPYIAGPGECQSRDKRLENALTEFCLNITEKEEGIGGGEIRRWHDGWCRSLKLFGKVGSSGGVALCLLLPSACVSTAVHRLAFLSFLSTSSPGFPFFIFYNAF